MIRNVNFTGDFASIKQGFKWLNIPRFAVIAGINGSGKSKLLEALNRAFRNDSHINSLVAVDTLSIPPHMVKHLAANHNIEQLNTGRGALANLEEDNTHVLSNIRGRAITDNDWGKLVEATIKRSKRDVKDLSGFTDDEIMLALPPDTKRYLVDGFNNQFISEIFKAYQEKINQIKLACFKQKNFLDDHELYEIIGSPPPWKTINQLFEKYNFVYRINEPLEANVRYNPQFIDTTDQKKNADFTMLSSGEKIIVSLILWSYNSQLGAKNKIFLLDEFDAHLNPSLSKMFIEVIKEKIVDEYGIQVIMTTHSPSTVAHVDDQDLFWLERSKDIRQSSRREIIPILSDGIITVDEGSADLSLIYKIDHSNKPIVFVEGMTDKLILEYAWEKVYSNTPMPFSIQDAFDCNFIVSLFRREDIFKNYKDKLFLGLLDFDDAYSSFKEKCEKKYFLEKDSNPLLYKSKEHNGYVVMLPIPEFRKHYAGKDLRDSYLTIELLFMDETVVGYCDQIEVAGGAKLLKFRKDKKVDFAQKSKGFTADAFINFKPLFTKILEIIDSYNKKAEKNAA